jgi:hypothetical protein
MENSVNDVEGEFLVGVYFVFLGVGDGGSWTDEDFSEVFFIDGKGDAIGGGWVVKKLGVKL